MGAVALRAERVILALQRCSLNTLKRHEIPVGTEQQERVSRSKEMVMYFRRGGNRSSQHATTHCACSTFRCCKLLRSELPISISSECICTARKMRTFSDLLRRGDNFVRATSAISNSARQTSGLGWPYLKNQVR
eukprot:6206145-Pleurochrysis_carterae.AAC.2